MNIKLIISYIILLCLFGCSVEFLLPEGCITVLVVDEQGNPMEGINVGIGFEKNTGSGTVGIPVRGVTGVTGKFIGKHNTLKDVQYRAYMEGYYQSSGDYKFKNHVGKKWQPWNPELKLILRKIEKPVPMYARDTQHSKHIELPLLNKEIGFDLINYDWVKPYGIGEKSDFIFKLNKKYIDDENYEAKLSLSFSHNNDGIVLENKNYYSSSEFKLPRYAPNEGYKNTIVFFEKRQNGKIIGSTEKKDNNFIFRIRSKKINRQNPEPMYGKIQGDIRFEPRGRKTAVVLFRYYLNPDHSRNLEFDPKRNLFTDLQSFEQVGL